VTAGYDGFRKLKRAEMDPFSLPTDIFCQKRQSG
jgi:hypothetical protein